MKILDTLSVANPNATTVTAGLACKYAGDGSIALCAAGDSPDGIAQYTTDGAVSLLYDGMLPGTAGGVIVPGGEVKVGAGGKFVATAPGDVPCGRYFGAANCAADDTIIIQLYRKGRNGVVDSGSAALVAGTVTVASARVHPTSVVRYSRQAGGAGALGHLKIANIVDGVSFDIVASVNTDVSTVFWEILG